MALASNVAFGLNLACLVITLMVTIFIATANVKRMFKAQKCMNNLGCLICLMQLTVIILVPIYLFEDKVDFCSGGTWIDPTTGLESNIMWNQLYVPREALRRTWVSELVLYFTFSIVICVVSCCCILPMAVKMAGSGMAAAAAQQKR